MLGVGLVLSAVLPWSEPLFSQAIPRVTIPATDFDKPSTIVSKELDNFSHIEQIVAPLQSDEDGYRYYYCNDAEDIELVIIADDTVKAPVIMTSKDVMDNIKLTVEDSVLKFEIDMHTAFAHREEYVTEIGDGVEVRLLVPQSMVKSISSSPGDDSNISMIGYKADKFAVDGRVGLTLDGCRFGDMELSVPNGQTFSIRMTDTDIRHIDLDMGNESIFSTLYSPEGTVGVIHAVCRPLSQIKLGDIQIGTLEYEMRDQNSVNNCAVGVALGPSSRVIRFEK